MQPFSYVATAEKHISIAQEVAAEKESRMDDVRQRYKQSRRNHFQKV